jgi:hypothetical protein
MAEAERKQLMLDLAQIVFEALAAGASEENVVAILKTLSKEDFKKCSRRKSRSRDTNSPIGSIS